MKNINNPCEESVMIRKALFAVIVFISISGFALAESADYVPGQILVRFAGQGGQVMTRAAKGKLLDSVIQGCSMT